MRSILNYLEYGIIRIILWIIGLFTVDTASNLIGYLARFLGPFHKSSNVARKNLKIAFPNWTKDKIENTIQNIWENLGRTAAELPFIFALPDSEINKRLTIKYTKNIKAILDKADTTPIIFISGHFANWEMMIKAILILKIKPSVVYRKSNNPLVNKLINALRFHKDVEHIPKGQKGTIKIFKALKQKRSLALLVDQKLNNGIKAQFLNKEAMTTNIPAKLALKFNLPIIYGEIIRHKGMHFSLNLHQIHLAKIHNNEEENITKITQTINDIIEKQAKTYPGQWFWLHKRFDKKFYN